MYEGTSVTTRRAAFDYSGPGSIDLSSQKLVSEKIDSIKGLINNYNRSKPGNFDDQCKALEEVYKEFKALSTLPTSSPLYFNSRNCLGTILCIYARTHYPRFEDCKNLYLYALSTYNGSLENCCSIELPFDQFETLDELKIKLKTEDLSALEKFVIGDGREFIIRRSFNEEDALFIAHNYRFLGHCYQNIDAYIKAGDQKMISLFEMIYSVNEILLKEAKEGSEGHKELTELYYNSWPFVYWLKNPNDPLGKMGIYDTHVLSRDSSDPMMARVLNMKSIISENDLKDLDKAIEYAEASFSIRQRIDNNNPFLLANLKNNLAKLYLKAYPDKLGMPDMYLTEAVAFAEAEREKGNFHPYHAFYFQGLCGIRIKQGRVKEALELINKAIDILEKETGGSYGEALAAYKNMRDALIISNSWNIF